MLEFIWLATIFLVSVAFLPQVYPSFDLPKIVLFKIMVAVLTCAFLGKFLYGKWARSKIERGEKSARTHKFEFFDFKSKKVWWLLGGVAILALFSALFSEYKGAALFGTYPRFQGYTALIFYVIFGLIVFLNIKNHMQIERFIKMLAMTTIFVAMIGLLQKTPFNLINFWNDSDFLGRIYSTIGHPNFLANFLIMVIPVLIAKIVFGGKRKAEITALILALAALYFTLSRSAILGLIVGMFVFLVVYARKTGHKYFYFLSLLLPILVTGAVIFVNLNPAAINLDNKSFVNSNILNRLVLNGENLRSIESRFAIWPAAWILALKKPLLGHGPDTFAKYFEAVTPAKLKTLEKPDEFADHAHNFFIDYVFDYGFINLFLFLFFLGYVFYRGNKYIFNKEIFDWPLILGFLSAIIAVLTANQFGFFTTVDSMLLWLYIFMVLRFCVDKKINA